MAGYIATQYAPTEVFSCLIASLTLSIVCTATGSYLIDFRDKNSLEKFGSTFFILALVLASFLITVNIQGKAGTNNLIMMCCILAFMTLVLIFDTNLMLKKVRKK